MVRRRAGPATDRPRRAAERGGLEPQPSANPATAIGNRVAAPRRITLRTHHPEAHARRVGDVCAEPVGQQCRFRKRSERPPPGGPGARKGRASRARPVRGANYRTAEVSRRAPARPPRSSYSSNSAARASARRRLLSGEGDCLPSAARTLSAMSQAPPADENERAVLERLLSACFGDRSGHRGRHRTRSDLASRR
jgi:hypothetical protein